MRRQRRTTIIVAGGALAIASVGYGLGTQADDGTAVAESSQQRNGGPRALFFERGAPPGFSDLADTLGVDANELRRALRDFHDQEHADRREELSKAAADALGISADRVSDALDRLHEKHEVRRADRMAPPPGRGLHVRHALPLRQLATQLGVSRADLRKAFTSCARTGPDRASNDTTRSSRSSSPTASSSTWTGSRTRWPSWGRHYAPGIAQDYRTIPQLLEEAVAAVPDKEWLLFEDETHTYAQARERVAAAAAGLRRHGVAQGDLVLATARNDSRYLFLWLATAYAGAVYVAVDPRQTETELRGLVGQVEPKLVVTDAELDELFAEPGELDGPGPVVHDDPAVMIPTSGTTGRSKLVMQTHLAYVLAGEGFPWWMGLTPVRPAHDVAPALPHQRARVLGARVGGRGARASCCLPGFSASTFLDTARRYGATEFNAIGAMLEILMRQPERPDDADEPLRLCYTGPSPDRERHLEIEARFGIEIICGYALSESPYGLIWRHGTRPYGTLGSIRQHPELGVINEGRVVGEGGHPVGNGEIGELELRNPVITKGYYEMPEETAAVIHDGWLRTGDLVRDNGDETYTFVGRKKEVIRRRGENLSPSEVEAVLDRPPSVAESAVIGVPSELSEEEVKAFVVMREGADADFDELRDWASERLTPFKVPSLYEALDELPHTATGRVAKHRLPT